MGNIVCIILQDMAMPWAFLESYCCSWWTPSLSSFHHSLKSTEKSEQLLPSVVFSLVVSNHDIKSWKLAESCLWKGSLKYLINYLFLANGLGNNIPNPTDLREKRNEKEERQEKGPRSLCYAQITALTVIIYLSKGHSIKEHRASHLQEEIVRQLWYF